MQNPKKHDEATSDARIVLSTIASTEQRFNVGHIIDIISGADNKSIHRYNHHKLKNYGAGKDKDRKHWWQIIDNLIAQKLIIQTDDINPSIKLSPRAYTIIKGIFDIQILYGTKKRDGEIQIYDGNKDLFDKLRVIRRRIASVQHVPPHIIFSDRILREMAHLLPTSEKQLLCLTGIGESKIARYGNYFLKEIKDYMRKHPNAKRYSPKQNTYSPNPKGINKSPINMSIEKTWKMVNDDLTLRQIAVLRNLSQSTILLHLERLIIEGKNINIKKYLSEEKIAYVENLLTHNNTALLSDLISNTHGVVSYEEARLVRAYLRRLGKM